MCVDVALVSLFSYFYPLVYLDANRILSYV
jgi:hypothetical protein